MKKYKSIFKEYNIDKKAIKDEIKKPYNDKGEDKVIVNGLKGYIFLIDDTIDKGIYYVKFKDGTVKIYTYKELFIDLKAQS